MAKIDLYTVVQHSGYGYSKNPQFARGLETRHVGTAAVRDRVRKAGGVLFADTAAETAYVLAEDWAEEEMYREAGPSDLIPQAPGTFADTQVDGLRVYVPKAP